MNIHPPHIIELEDETDSIDQEGSWAISYGDMVTLLLSFFILFFNLDSATQKLKEKSKENEKVKSTLLSVFREKTSKNKSSENLALEKTLKSTDWNGKIFIDNEKIIVDFSEISFFNSGQTTVTNDGLKALRDFVELFIPYVGQHTLSVRAFTDSKSVRKIPGRIFTDNLELSTFRALSTMRALQKIGIPLKHMRISGYGELIKHLNTLKDSSLERRIMLVIEPTSGDHYEL